MLPRDELSIPEEIIRGRERPGAEDGLIAPSVAQD